MFKNDDPSFGSYFKLPNPGLRAYFGIVEKGQPLIYDTPFAKGESTTQMLKSWDETLKSISTKWPTLYDFEQDLRAKVGPLSVMAPLEDRIDDIDAYYKDIDFESEPIQGRALKAVLSEWKHVGKLRPRSVGSTWLNMKKSSNSGSPFFTKRKLAVDETLPAWNLRITQPSNGILIPKMILNGTDWNLCAVLGWRGQEGGHSKEDVKQRVVWMFPLAVNIEELRVYQPLIEAAQNFNIIPAWVSMDEVDKQITQLFDTKGSEDLVVCTDFTKFDQHFNQDMYGAAQTIIQNLFVDSVDMKSWHDNTFMVKYCIPLAIGEGKMAYGWHGMGSGSGGTNADETLAHRALQYEAALNHGARLNPHSMCLGDDGVLSYPGITVDDVVQSYSRHGQEMNTTKQYASTQDCVYLRRWHHQRYRINGVCAGVYSTMRALGRLRYLERFQDPRYWNSKMVALRQLSIMENVKFHPLKEQFAQFCMKRDKYRLGLDIPGFLDNLELEVKEAIDHMPDFLGYTQTLQGGASDAYGINNWWIVNYLRSQR